MKKVLLVASITLLSSALEAQAVKESQAVGVENDKPRATLDVGGDVRIQNVPQYQKGQTTPEAKIYADCPCNLIVDENGVIKRVPIKIKDWDPNNLPPVYVKDRNYGDGEHDFIYKVITGPDGKKWLNNNLGADYANVHSSYYNPDQQATSPDDYHAYGSLFQWQRKADGHELMIWDSSTSGRPVNGTTDQLASSWTNAGTNNFIKNDTDTYAWVNNSLNAAGPFNLWQSSGANNPCPVGYHVPTHEEQEALIDAIDSNVWSDMVLRLSATGSRDASFATVQYEGSDGYYWSGSKSSSKFAWGMYSLGGTVIPSVLDYRRGYGMSIRCIQD